MKSSKLKTVKEPANKSNINYKSMSENLTDFYFKADIKGALVIVSSSCLDFLGYSKIDEVLGRTLEDFFQDPNEYSKFLTFLRNTEKVNNYHTTLINKDHSAVYSEITANILLDDTGNYVGLEGIVRDLSKLKEGKYSPQHSEKVFRSIFENAPLGLLLFDEKGQIIICNDMFVEIIGSSHDKLKGLDITKLPDKKLTSAIKAALSGSIGKYEGYYNSLTAEKITPVRVQFTPITDVDGVNHGGVGIIEDISDQKQIAEALSGSEEKYKTLLDFAPDAFFQGDSNGNFITVNRKAIELTGYSKEKLLTMNMSDLLPPNNNEPLRYDLLRLGATIKKEREILKMTGERIHVEMSSNAMPDGTFQCFMRDCTNSKRVEQDLKDSENKYKYIADKSPDAIWTMDLNFQTTYMSKSVEHLLGYTVDEYISLPLNERLPAESYEFLVKEFATSLQKVKNGEVDVTTFTTNYELLHRHKNGELKWGDVNCSFMYDENKNITGIHGITRDISHRKKTEEALKESEERYRKLVELSPFSIAIYQDDLFVYVNPAGINLVGAASEQELIGKSVLSIIHPDSRKEVIKRMEIVKLGISTSSMEEKLICLDGTTFDVDIVVIATTYNMKPAGQIIIRNITERKKVERKLKVSEERFKQLIKNSSDTIVLLDSNGIQLFVSESCERSHGYKPEELINIPVIERMIHPDDQEKTLTAFQQIIKNGYGGAQYRHKHKNGGWVYLEAIGSNQLDNPAINAVIVNVRDISERKKVEKALVESQNKLNTIFENTVDGILLVNDQGEIIDWNKGMVEISGYLKDEVIGEKVWKLQHRLASGKIKNKYSEEDLKNIWLNEFTRLNDKESQIREGQILNKSGESKIVEDLISPLFINEKKFMCVIQRDITVRKSAELALKESEEKYRTLLEFAPEAFFQGDCNGNFITVNDKAVELSGYSRAELLTMNFSDLFLPETLEEKPLKYDLLKIGDTLKIEREVKRKNHEKIHVVMSTIVMPDGTYQCFMNDITERKHAEEILLKLNHQLNDLNNTKDKLFSIISHDLRSPFNNIIGFSDLLHDNIRKLNYEKSEFFSEQINYSAKQTLNLLDNLLAWAKTQIGHFDYKPGNLLLEPIIQKIIDLLSPAAKMKNISINHFQSEDIVTYADENMLQIILRNLISNAIKFTNLGGKVDIYAIIHLNQIEITVSDNGIGMNEEAQKKLFKLDSNYTTIGTANEKGYGLGLILCQEFTIKQGGNIWVESELGKGSMFKFTLPMSNPKEGYALSD